MKRTLALTAALAGALALTASSSVHAQPRWGHGPHGPHISSHSFSFGMHQGRLGAQVTSMTPSLRSHFGAPADAGLMVGKVLPNTAAAKAGLHVGDIITHVDGKKVNQPWDVMTSLATKKKGDKVSLRVIRNKRTMTLHATMQDSGFNIHGLNVFGKNFGKNFGKQWGHWGNNWSKHFGKDFDVIIKSLKNGKIDIKTLRNWAHTPGNGNLAKKLKETMKKVLELEKALKKMQKTK